MAPALSLVPREEDSCSGESSQNSEQSPPRGPSYTSDPCIHPVVSRPSAPLAVQCTCFLFQADWLSFKILGTTLVLWGMSCHAEEVHICSRTAIIPTYRNTEFRVMPSKVPVSSFASLSRRLSPYSNGQGSAMVPTSTSVP